MVTIKIKLGEKKIVIYLFYCRFPAILLVTHIFCYPYIKPLDHVQTDATTPNIFSPKTPGVVASVCTWLKVWPVSNFAQQLSTTRNKVCKQTRHVTSNNVASVYTKTLRFFKKKTKKQKQKQPTFFRLNTCDTQSGVNSSLALKLVA